MMLQDREKVVLEILKELPKANVVLIGGYAVNAYVPPRFSIDCDLVLLDDPKIVEAALKRCNFSKTETGDVPYGNYMRYFRENEKVAFDLLVNSVLDRDTGIVFESALFKKYSKFRTTVGRANPIRIEIRIVDPELLFAMKFVCARKQDIRDMFMLAGENLNRELIAELLLKKCNTEQLKEISDHIRKAVESKTYRDSLHGAYGWIPDERFALCQKRLIEILDILKTGLEIT